MQNSLLYPSDSILPNEQSNEQLLAIIARQQAIIEQQQAALKVEKAQSQEKDRYIQLIEEYLALFPDLLKSTNAGRLDEGHV